MLKIEAESTEARKQKEVASDSQINPQKLWIKKTKNLDNTAEIKCYISDEGLSLECKGISILQGNDINIYAMHFLRTTSL